MIDVCYQSRPEVGFHIVGDLYPDTACFRVTYEKSIKDDARWCDELRVPGELAAEHLIAALIESDQTLSVWTRMVWNNETSLYFSGSTDLMKAALIYDGITIA